MDDVTLGPGDLAGTGVYAARDFAVGEVVVSYELKPLDEAAYLALPAGADIFVHSYGGRRYLYPAPARFVNHSDDPSCYQDFERGCDIALRPIARGDRITIDATEETSHELGTFLDAYRHALREGTGELLTELVGRDVSLWVAGRAARGREAYVAMVSEAGWVSLSEAEWLVGTGRWEALCSAEAETARGRRHQTMLLKVIAGNWQIVYHHAG
ncbi:SET domain-containing protein-lysine N-methyltransferase [Streptomyces cyaneofuscatus]|uniref:SET domain-containing protein-lysine N-methyltransferase n=1 Tax=Streptomyces cyaneofuscatus TaxID=66883 RepID=UPI00369226C5